MDILTFLLWFYTVLCSYDGYAVHYAPGVMERVAKNRGLPIEECMISTPHSEDLGAWVIVESQYGRMACQITDVSHPRDKQRHLDTKTTVELGWEAAKVLCNINKVGEKSKKDCPVTLYIIERKYDDP